MKCSGCILFIISVNRRIGIIKQDGAFILCGLSNDTLSLNRFRYKYRGKTVILLVGKKEKLREQLANFSINYATLFPEIECVAEHIKEYYE